jgi:superfamily I DNA/RNA helicase
VLAEDEFALLRAVVAECLEEADSLRGLVDLVRNRIAQPEVPLETPYARVMSFHKSKGLTADLVVLDGLVQGSIPRVDWDAPDAAQQLEEQRRLFFVGMTRTTNILVLSSYSALDFPTALRLGASTGARLSAGPRRPDDRYRVVASHFLDELGPGLPPAVRGGEWVY